MIRILVLGLRGFPDIQGGIERHSENLYPLLVRMGCKVDAIVRSPYSHLGQTTWKGITYHRLWAPQITGIEAFVHSILGVFYAAIKRPDILHVHGIGPAIVTPLARLFGLRVVVTHHGPDYNREKWGYFARWLLHLGEKWGMKYSHQRIVISQVICDLIRKKYDIDTVVIPNGVNLPEIPETTFALEKFGLDKGRYVLIVSRFVPEKRHLDLIYAFNEANLLGWKLVLVGDADHPDEYSRKVRSVSKKLPNVVITGFQSGLPLAELYTNAGIFVLPSSHEGLPIAMLEALSYSVPVLASDIPANLEVGLQEKYYFPLGDTMALAEAMRRLANEESKLRQSWIKERYSWPQIAMNTLEVYKRAVAGSSATS